MGTKLKILKTSPPPPPFSSTELYLVIRTMSIVELRSSPLMAASASPHFYSTLLSHRTRKLVSFHLPEPCNPPRQSARCSVSLSCSRQSAKRPRNMHFRPTISMAEAPSNRESMVPPYNVLITGSTKGRRLAFIPMII